MRHLVVLFIHFIATLARLLGPGGVRSLVAESLLLKHQLLIVNRSRQRTPNLRSSDRILAGLLALLVRRTRLLRPAIVLKPSTLLAIHKEPSHPYLNGRANAESICVTTNRKSPLVSMATSLSILISDTSGCVIFRRLSIAPVSGQPWEDFQLNHLVLAFLVAARFANPIVFTPTVSIRQTRDIMFNLLIQLYRRMNGWRDQPAGFRWFLPLGISTII